MPSSAAGTKVASSMPPFHPEEAALSRHISLNTKATCAQPLARAPRIGKGLRRVLCPTLLRGGAWPLPVLAKGRRGIRFLQITMSHSHPSASLVLLGAQNRSVSRLVFQNAPFPKALFHIDVCSDTSAALETLVMPHISLASWVSQPRPSLPRETQRFPTKRREARRRRTRGGAVLGRIEPAALGCRPLRPLLLLVILGSEGGDGGGATNRRGLWRSGMWRPSKCVAD